MILSRVTPVTHSIGICVKRVVVIVSSVIIFQTPVTCVSLPGSMTRSDFLPLSMLNAFGTALALGGVFAYSQVTAKKGGD